MVSEEKNQEMSVNEILSSIKEVISNEKVSKNIDDEDEILELTDVVSGEDDSILLDDVIDPDDLVEKQNANENLTDDIKKNLHLDESGFLSESYSVIKKLSGEEGLKYIEDDETTSSSTLLMRTGMVSSTSVTK